MSSSQTRCGRAPVRQSLAETAPRCPRRGAAALNAYGAPRAANRTRAGRSLVRGCPPSRAAQGQRVPNMGGWALSGPSWPGGRRAVDVLGGGHHRRSWESSPASSKGPPPGLGPHAQGPASSTRRRLDRTDVQPHGRLRESPDGRSHGVPSEPPTSPSPQPHGTAPTPRHAGGRTGHHHLQARRRAGRHAYAYQRSVHRQAPGPTQPDISMATEPARRWPVARPAQANGASSNPGWNRTALRSPGAPSRLPALRASPACRQLAAADTKLPPPPCDSAPQVRHAWKPTTI